MFGYSLEGEGTPIELINVRVRAVGYTEKPSYVDEPYAGKDAGGAQKGERAVYLPEQQTSEQVCVFDGHKLRHGNQILGPALIEQANTTLLLSSTYDCVCDRYGSFVVYKKGEEHRLPKTLQEIIS